MSTIGGPGGIGGPSGPSGPDGPSEIEVDAIVGEAPVEQARSAGEAAELDALAAEVAAGRLTPHEAIDRLIEATAGAGAELGAAERAELRELLTDLVTNDPYLGALVGRV